VVGGVLPGRRALVASTVDLACASLLVLRASCACPFGTRASRSRQNRFLRFWCSKEDLNLHNLAVTRP
jgi:hypothetical protein